MTIQRRDQPIVYHYCSMPALMGILSSGKIRLTQFRYANDSEEVHWTYKLAGLVLDKLSKYRKRETDDWAITAVETFISALGSSLRNNQDPSYFPWVFCGCFSYDADSLSQWRAYADDGRGAAIGISLSYLNEIEYHLTNTKDITYDLELQEKSILDLISKSIDEVRETALRHDQVPEDLGATKALHCSRALQDFAYFAKNPAFREERELRVQFIPQPADGRIGLVPKTPMGPISFFERQGVIIPYFELPLIGSDMKSGIQHVVLGPRNRANENTSAIQVLTASLGYPLALSQISRSSASYR